MAEKRIVTESGGRTITVAEHAGFCFGVRRAIAKAEQAAAEQAAVCSMGPLIHNERVAGDLEKQGVRIIDSLDQAKPEDEVLFPSAYLDADMNYGSYSSWTYTNNQNEFDSFTQQLSYYYEQNPDKYPEYVYILESDFGQIELLNEVIDLDNYKMVEGKRGCIFVAKE